MTMNATLGWDSGARNLHPRVFLKPDAFGRRPSARSPNFKLHAYVGADPVNFTDPSGLNRKKPDIPPKQDGGGTTITVTGSRRPAWETRSSCSTASKLTNSFTLE